MQTSHTDRALPRTLAVPLLVLLLAAFVRADVLVVDAAGGPGSDATQISTAVGLAVDGDVILVRAGSYGPFSIVGRSLTVVADTGAAVVVQGSSAVRDLTASRQVLLRGLTLQGAPGHGLLIDRCDGPVWVEGCTLTGAEDMDPLLGTGGDGLRVQNSEAVVVVRCTATGGAGGGPVVPGGGSGGAGIGSANSTLAVHGGSFTGGAGFGGFVQPDDEGGHGGVGARITSGGSAFLGGAAVTGGRGGDAEQAIACPDPGNGGAAVQALFNAHARLLDVVAVGGLPGESVGVSGPSCRSGLPGPASLTLAPASITAVTGRSRSVRIPSPVREGGAVSVILMADPGDVAWVMASPLATLLPLPEYKGALHVPVTTPLLLVGAVPGAGPLLLSTTLPALPAGLEGAVIHVSSVFTGTADGIVLGGPATLVALDDAF